MAQPMRGFDAEGHPLIVLRPMTHQEREDLRTAQVIAANRFEREIKEYERDAQESMKVLRDNCSPTVLSVIQAPGRDFIATWRKLEELYGLKANDRAAYQGAAAATVMNFDVGGHVGVIGNLLLCAFLLSYGCSI